jgi:toxin ParE1/3/4
MKPATLHEEAEAELRDALGYYAGQRHGLDGEFRREFEAALEQIRENPQTYAVEDDNGVRYCPLRRFPYTLVYVDLEDRIWVAAVAHQRRRPRYWASRRAAGD